MSLRHVSLREMGMEQNYEFRIPRETGIRGKATHGKFANTLACSQKMSFERGPALRIAESLSNPQVHARSCWQEKHGDIEENVAARRRAAINTTRNRSKFSPAGRAPASAMYLARRARWLAPSLGNGGQFGRRTMAGYADEINVTVHG